MYYKGLIIWEMWKSILIIGRKIPLLKIQGWWCLAYGYNWANIHTFFSQVECLTLIFPSTLPAALWISFVLCLHSQPSWFHLISSYWKTFIHWKPWHLYILLCPPPWIQVLSTATTSHLLHLQTSLTQLSVTLTF